MALTADNDKTVKMEYFNYVGVYYVDENGNFDETLESSKNYVAVF